MVILSYSNSVMGYKNRAFPPSYQFPIYASSYIRNSRLESQLHITQNLFFF